MMCFRVEMQLFIVVFVWCFCSKFVTTTYINGEQENWNTKFSQSYYNQQQQGATGAAGGACPQYMECVALSACPPLQNVVNQGCVERHRLGSFSCGNSDQNNPLVCCPQGYTFSSSWQNPSQNSDYSPSVASGTRVSPTITKRVDDACGKSVVQGPNYQGLGAQPWVARIGFRNSRTGEVKYPCAGSIINHRIILTAAHCALAKADSYKLFSVRIGEWRTDSSLDCGDEFCALPLQDIALSHVIVHPGYDQQTFKDDIALLVLRSDINYTITAQPICLVDAWSQPSTQAILVGWGRAAGQQAVSPIQQSIQLPVVPLQQCINIYSRTIPITENHLCAGGVYGKDACEGFGGAPLIVKHNNINFQIGILSFGSNQCGAAGVPSVYASVKKYSQWIKENLPVIYS